MFCDVLQRTLHKGIHLTPHTIRILPVPPGGTVPYHLLLLFELHSLWGCRMIDRDADAPHTTESILIEIIGQAKIVYQQIGQPQDWFLLFNSSFSLPDF